MGFPGDSVVKNLPANATDVGLIPGSGRSLEEEMATHFSILAWEIAWWAPVHRVIKSWTWLSTQAHTWTSCLVCFSIECVTRHFYSVVYFSFREGSGNPLQHSCLENPMESLRVRQDWATSLSLFTFMHWRRKWQPTPVFLPGESQGLGRLVGCHLWGRTESDMTEVT